jgi:organic radical activating enzyme
MGHAIHDFTAKLRQPAVLPLVMDYVKWRRACREAEAKGEAAPAAPAIAPISINLDLTTACNFRCDHCIDWDILNTPNKHDVEVLRNSLKEMRDRGLRSVILIGGGEPTLHPKFVEMVRYMKEELDLQIAVVTNGTGNHKIMEVADCLDERDWVRLSLDSGTNDTFVAMHKPVNPQVTLQGICEWVPKIKAINPRFKYGFSFIIVWKGAQRDDVNIVENFHEMKLATQLARDYEFDYISMKPFLVRSATGSEIMDPEKAEYELQAMTKRIRALVDECKELGTDTFKVLESTNLRMLEKGNWEEYTKQPQVCHMQALRQVLTPTGLFNCPAYRGVERAKISDKAAFKDAETADETNVNLRGQLDTFDAAKECAEVTCLYNDVNWWLDGLVKSDDDLDAVMTAGDERYDYFL